jgi:hypothetical protein
LPFSGAKAANWSCGVLVGPGVMSMTVIWSAVSQVTSS